MDAGSDAAGASWLDGAGGSSKALTLQLNTAVVGEAVEALVWLTNPLTLELHLSRLRLTFELEPMPADGNVAGYAEV